MKKDAMLKTLEEVKKTVEYCEEVIASNNSRPDELAYGVEPLVSRFDEILNEDGGELKKVVKLNRLMNLVTQKVRTSVTNCSYLICNHPDNERGDCRVESMEECIFKPLDEDE
jgi:hypothetical protein